MGSLLLLSMIGFGLMAVSMGTETEEENLTEQEDVYENGDLEVDGGSQQEEPEADLSDTGASVEITDATIRIDVGDDETGRIVGVRSASEIVLSPGGNSGGIDYDINFYLVPEGVDFPPSPSEIIDENSELDEYNIGKLDYYDYFDNIGLKPISTIDLGEFRSFSSDDGSDDQTVHDTRISDLEIISNQEVELIGFNTSDSGFIGDDDFVVLDDVASLATNWEDDWPKSEIHIGFGGETLDANSRESK